MSSIEALLKTVAILRSPGGCPWDLEQTPESMRPYILEEAHEVLDAIGNGDPADLRKELGDLLFQIVLLSRMAEERGDFTFDDVARGINEKMLERHPHVFVEGHVEEDPGSVAAWEARKEKKREAGVSMMDGIPSSLPALLGAHRVGEKASKVGFDWPTLDGVKAKMAEELSELEHAIENEGPDRVESEYGDLLLATANVGRFIGVDPEFALRGANARFEQRFRLVERLANSEGLRLFEMDVPALEEIWGRAKSMIGGD